MSRNASVSQANTHAWQVQKLQDDPAMELVMCSELAHVPTCVFLMALPVLELFVHLYIRQCAQWVP